MNRLLEKQARKEGMGEKGQEPKLQSNGTAKPKKDLAPAPKKEKEVPFVTSVPLPAKKVRAELSSFMAAHETTYAQVIALSELMHEAFEPHRIDLTWASHVDVSASTRSWLNRPASLLPEDSIGAIVEWLDHIPQKHVKEVPPHLPVKSIYMCVGICICMYIRYIYIHCTYVCIHVQARTPMRTHTYTYTHTHTHAHLNNNAYTHTQVHPHPHPHEQARSRTRAHVHKRTHICAYIYIHIRTYLCM